MNDIKQSPCKPGSLVKITGGKWKDFWGVVYWINGPKTSTIGVDYNDGVVGGFVRSVIKNKNLKPYKV